MAAYSYTDALNSILKTYFKDNVPNLLGRESPLLKKIKTVRVEGKQVSYPAIYSAGGAVSPSHTVAKRIAESEDFNAREWAITPGREFSVTNFNAKEVQQSLTKRGAYMKIAGTKVYTQTARLRKRLAGDLYSRGFGEIARIQESAGVTLTQNTSVAINMPTSGIKRIQPGAELVVKASVGSSTILATLHVDKIDVNTVYVTNTTATYAASQGDVICASGAMSGGNPTAPMGLAGWIPAISKRASLADDANSNWPAYVNTAFYGIQRDENTEALCGAFVDGTSDAKFADTIQKLMLKLRNAGSEADLIVMNPEDFLAFSNEVQTSNTYFTATSTKAKREANVGFDKFSASFSTNYIDLVWDDPFLEKGVVYILDTETVEFWTLTNVDPVTNDGVAENNPGNQDPMEFDNKGHENDPYKLLIDDYLSVVPGSGSDEGESTRVTINVFATLALLNTAVNGVALLKDYDPAVGLATAI